VSAFWNVINKSVTDCHSYWAEYNQALTAITDKKKYEDVLIAKGSGHFIQTDRPDFVAVEIAGMLSKLKW
jgi:hypothetical protein